jgi:hypothetical protein
MFRPRFIPRQPTPALSYTPLLAKTAETGETGETAETAARTPSTRRTRRALVYCLPLVSLLLTGMSCSNSTVIISVTHSQASALRLSLTIRDQYSDKPAVQVFVEIRDATTNQLVGLAKPAHLTCNGQDIMPIIQGSEHACPRQPPGGAYQIAYTDEHGASTTLTVPVPKGAFTLLSPQPGAHVPIPTNYALSVRFSLPLPVTQASLDDSVSVWCGAVGHGPLCGGVDSTEPSSLPTPVTTPSVANGIRSTPTPDTTVFSCPPSPPLENGVVSVRADQVTLNLTGDFSSFLPGPGGISVSMSECTMPDPAGFASVLVTFADSLTAPITWVY